MLSPSQLTPFCFAEKAPGLALRLGDPDQDPQPQRLCPALRGGQGEPLGLDEVELKVRDPSMFLVTTGEEMLPRTGASKEGAWW